LTQKPGGSTFQTLARREKRPLRTRGRSGTAADLQERYAIRRTPWRGLRGGRKQWHGQSAAAPAPSFLSPLGAARGGKAQRLFERVAEPTGSQNVAWLPTPAQGGGSPAAQRPCERGCPDRSADRCADWCTDPSVRARACGGLDTAEAPPRRRASWRSRGRRSARATTRPCRLSAVQTGLLTAARPDVSGKPLGREPRPAAAALRLRLAAPARTARSGGDTHAPGLPPTGCPHGLGKRGRTDSRTAAIRGAWAGCLLEKHREATRRVRRLWRGSRRPCGGRGVVSHGGARSKRDGESPRTVR